MKTGSFLICIIFIIFSQSAFAGKDSDWQGIPPKWRVCSIDSDCEAGVESCLYWEPINKEYIKALSKSLDGCTASIDPGFQPVTVCVNKTCQATDKTTDVSWEDWLDKMQKMKVKKH
jgi:hypothetical protein